MSAPPSPQPDSLADAPGPAQRAPASRRILAAVFYAVVAGVLGWYLSRLDYAVLGRLELGWGYLAAALCVGCAQRFLLPVIWVLMLRSLGQRVRQYASYNAIYARGWIGRYLPGKVAMVAVRVYLAETVGASRAAIAVSSVAELGAQLLVAVIIGLVGLAFLPEDVPVLEEVRPVAWVLGGVLVLVLWPPFFNAVSRVGMRLLRRGGEVPAVGARTLGWAAAGYAAVSLVNGLHAVLVAAAVDPAAFDHAFFIWGAIHLAGALGMALLFAPSGIGAREGVYLGLLVTFLSPEAALAVAVLSRLMDVAADAVFYALSLLFERWSRRRAHSSSPTNAA